MHVPSLKSLLGSLLWPKFSELSKVVYFLELSLGGGGGRGGEFNALAKK